jgi:hypothetical protein
VSIDDGVVDFKRQRFHPLGESLHRFRKLSVLLDHLDKEGGLLCGDRRPFLARRVQGLTMFGISEGMSHVAIGLPGLCQQDEWSRIRRLEAESEVQKNEWVDVEGCKSNRIDEDPNGDNDSLGDKETRRPEKASERFSPQGEPVVTEN